MPKTTLVPTTVFPLDDVLQQFKKFKPYTLKLRTLDTDGKTTAAVNSIDSFIAHANELYTNPTLNPPGIPSTPLDIKKIRARNYSLRALLMATFTHLEQEYSRKKGSLDKTERQEFKSMLDSAEDLWQRACTTSM